MYFSLIQAMFGANITAAHLKAAQNKVQPYFHGDFPLSHAVEPENFLGKSMTTTENKFGRLVWLELPQYFIPDVEQPSFETDFQDALMARGMLGVSDRTMVLIEQFDPAPNYVDRKIWHHDETGGLEVRQWTESEEIRQRAEIIVRIFTSHEGTTLVRHHKEHMLEGDLYTARCNAAISFIARAKRYTTFQIENLPDNILNDASNLLIRSQKEIQALCGNVLPPSPKEPEWEEKLTEYLTAFGFTPGTITALLNGERWPEGVGTTFEWETYAILTSSGDFEVTHDAVKSGEMLTHFPAPPTTDATRAAYYAELHAVMEAAKQAIKDLPRVASIARAYNLPVTRHWL